MKERLRFFTGYFVFWMLFFFIFRLVFVLYQYQHLVELAPSDFIGMAVRGAWMDLSLTGYVLLLASLFLALSVFWKTNRIELLFSGYTILLLLLFSTVAIADLELYRNWGYRIDATPLLYLKTPREAMASLSTFRLLLFIGLLGGAIFLFYRVYARFVRPLLSDTGKGRLWYIPVWVFIAAFMILPIRGGLGIAPMNPGKVFFSQKVFCNHAALNPVWNMMYSVSKSGVMSKRYPVNIDKSSADSVFTGMMHTGPVIPVLHTERPNIVVILLESFSSKLIEALGGKPGVTPCFNALSEEGILFARTVASGDRSDKGIIAVLSGFPAQPTQSIIKFIDKSRKLPTLSGVLVDSGYNAAFYYGGDPDFANIRSFLYHARFNRIITQDEFPRKYRNSKWGVHDEYLFNYLLADIDTARTPFFKFLFTLSNHEPFEIPAKHRFPGNDEVNMYLSSAYYTDSCLGDFISRAQKRDWYKNTLFILVADHGHRHLGNHPNYAPEKFAIPMLWLGGALSVDSLRLDYPASQIDIASTLLTQLNLPDSAFLFSKNLLADSITPFAYYAFNEGYGFVDSTDTLIYDFVGKRYITRKGEHVETTDTLAKAFFSKYQEVFLGY